MEGRIKNLKEYKEFRKIFEIFKYYPFYEAWKEQDFKDEFSYLKNNGEIFGWYLNNEEIIGLVSLIYGAKTSHPVSFSNPDKMMYLSDIAVLDKYRGQGVGGNLLDFAINYTNLLKYYEAMYLRTNLNGSMSEGIARSRGFEIIRNNNKIITEEVSFPRTNQDISETDTRKLLIKRF